MDREVLRQEIAMLASGNKSFARLSERNGPPPLWLREPSFETMTRLILEQQVSLASANAAYRRLTERLGTLEPDGFLSLSDIELKAVGFSGQKTSYVRGVADRILAGELDLAEIASLDDDEAEERLLEIRGVGKWTAACFLLFAKGSPDIWPSGDRALYVSIASVFRLGSVPDRETADLMASRWAPHRSTAARMLWHDYLGGREYVPSDTSGFAEGTGMVPK
jgi:DNA-3-methyladenine glycosylase II